MGGAVRAFFQAARVGNGTAATPSDAKGSEPLVYDNYDSFHSGTVDPACATAASFLEQCRVGPRRVAQVECCLRGIPFEAE